MKKLVSGALLGALLVLGACAEGARPELIAASTVANFPPGDPLHSSMSVSQAQGGSQTNPLWESNISSEAFKAGLETSLRNAGLLADSADTAHYTVLANLQGLQRPMMGLDLTVTMTVRYTVTPVGGGAPIFDDVVSASGVGRLSDAFVAVERLRIANEAAARANITEFIRRLRAQAPAGSVASVS